MIKAELHTHTSDDPHDFIPYDAPALIDRAAELNYQALAITLHDKQYDIRDLESYARDRGVVLISGIERTIHGKHVLLLNFPKAAENVSSFEDLERLKAESNGLVVAPHAFFPTRSCLGRALDQYPALFDAVELNAFYTPAIDFNQRAVMWANAHGKPLVGNCDVHRLSQLGTTYSLVDAAPDASAICDAIRAGRVRVCTEPISLAQAVGTLASMFFGIDGFDSPRRVPAESARPSTRRPALQTD